MAEQSIIRLISFLNSRSSCFKLCRGSRQNCGCGHEADMTVNERSPDDGQHNDRSDGQTPLKPSSCFFEWSLLPQHRLNGSTDLLRCDLCGQEVSGGEVSLKLHQIGLHINPYYLSASDRILAQISSYVVQTDKTEGPWVPDWDTFKVRIKSVRL